MLTNYTNTVLYAGVTDNLVKRVWQHKNKITEGFTSKYNVDKLVYYEITEDPTSAISREKSIKNLVRRKKDSLINDFNPGWEDLYAKILGEPGSDKILKNAGSDKILSWSLPLQDDREGEGK